jgi:hypothetical protein
VAAALSGNFQFSINGDCGDSGETCAAFKHRHSGRLGWGNGRSLQIEN